MAQMLGEREREEKILLLEDDVMIASGVKYALETEGYKEYHAGDVTKERKSDVLASENIIKSSK